MRDTAQNSKKEAHLVLMNGKPDAFNSEEELLGFLFSLNEAAKSFYEASAKSTEKEALRTYYWDIADTKEDIRIDLNRYIKVKGLKTESFKDKRSHYYNPFKDLSSEDSFDKMLKAEKRLLEYYQESLQTEISQAAKERIELYVVLERNIVAELERAKKDHS